MDTEQFDRFAGDRWQTRNRPLIETRLLPRQCGWVCRHLIPPFNSFLDGLKRVCPLSHRDAFATPRQICPRHCRHP